MVEVMPAVVGVLAAVLGSGFGAKFTSLALQESLRKTFATKDDVASIKQNQAHVSERVTVIEKEHVMMRQLMKSSQDEMSKYVVEPLRDLTETVAEMRTQQAAMASTMDAIKEAIKESGK